MVCGCESECGHGVVQAWGAVLFLFLSCTVLLLGWRCLCISLYLFHASLSYLTF